MAATILRYADDTVLITDAENLLQKLIQKAVWVSENKRINSNCKKKMYSC